MEYTIVEYVKRGCWGVVSRTLWPLCFHRLYYLRPLILRAFGARIALLNNIFGTVRIACPWNLTMGPRCTLGPNVNVYNLGHVSVGEDTVISQNAHICAGTHDITLSHRPLVKAPISIGDRVWICADAFIGPGVTIGDGAIVGARAVVVRDVPPNVVVVGNPARVIRTISQPERSHEGRTTL